MVSFEFQGKNFYIDDRLARQLDARVINELKKKDKDAVFVTDGPERSGKSVATQTWVAYIAWKLGVEVSIEDICMSPLEFRSRIEKAPKNSCIIYDEAHRGMASARALSEINNILKDLMMEMGQKNLCVFIILPTFFLLDKYAALFRARGVFHVYERKGQRGFWCYFNTKNKLRLYQKGKKDFNYNCIKWPNFRGRFYNQYLVDEGEYRKKKGKSFKDNPRMVKSEFYRDQRNKIVYALSKELEIGSVNLGKIMDLYGVGLKPRHIREILSAFRGKSKEM